MSKTELTFFTKFVFSIVAVLFGFFNMALGYFFKKKFDKVDKNSDDIQDLKMDIQELKTKMVTWDDDEIL